MNTFFYLAILLLNYALFVIDNSGDQMGLYGFSMLLTFAYTVSTIYSNYRQGVTLYKNFTNPAYIALLGFFIVNFQTIANTVLGLAPVSYYLNSYEYSSYTGKVAYAGSIGICTMVWAHSHYKPSLRTRNLKLPDLGLLWPWLASAAFLGFILNINVAFFISGEDYVASGGYDRVAKGYAVYEMLFEVFNTITLASIVGKSSSCDNRGLTIPKFLRLLPIYYIAINVIYILLRAASGDRGPVIYTLLMFFFAYIY